MSSALSRAELDRRVHGLFADVWRYLDRVVEELKVAQERANVRVEGSVDGHNWVALSEGATTVGAVGMEVATTLRVPPGLAWVRVTQGAAPRRLIKLEPWASAPLHDDAPSAPSPRVDGEGAVEYLVRFTRAAGQGSPSPERVQAKGALEAVRAFFRANAPPGEVCVLEAMPYVDAYSWGSTVDYQEYSVTPSGEVTPVLGATHG